LISAAVPTGQTAACWAVATKNGKYAYTTNAGSGSIAAYRVNGDGTIELLDGQAGLPGAGSTPIDAALSVDSQYLYTLNAGAHSITGFAVNADGSLTLIGGASGLIAGTVGLAAW
jgi:6-phosphogluconolactonase (cycloisomerase 2 family)